MKKNTTKQPLEDKKRYVPYGINGMYYIYDNENHFMIPGQAGSSSRRMIKRKCEQLNHEENTTPVPDSKEGLHTQGEWKVLPDSKHDRFYIVCGDDHIGGTWTYIREGKESKEEAKANAELIVKAVNFYQKLPRLAPDSEVPLPNDEYFLKCVNERKALLDSHGEMLEMMETINQWLDGGTISLSSNHRTHERIKKLITNAKNATK